MQGQQPADWFNEWVTYHATLFGMDRPEELATFSHWRAVFQRQGFTRDELTAASDFLATDPPKWRNEHLALIQGHIRQARRKARAGPAPDPDGALGRKACDFCYGTGWVCGLPDLRQVEGREWLGGATCAVLCDCGWGGREAARHRERQPMRLGEYQKKNPGWLDQVERHRAALKASRDAEAHGRYLDKVLGPILARVRALEAGGPPRLAGPADRKQ